MKFEATELTPIEGPPTPEKPSEGPERATEEQPEAAARGPTDKEMLAKLPDISDVEIHIETGSLGKRIEKIQEEHRLEAEKEEAGRREAEATEKRTQQAELEKELSTLLAEGEKKFMERDDYQHMVAAAIRRIMEGRGKTKELLGAGISSKREQVAVQDPVLDGCIAAMIENPLLAANLVVAAERFAVDTAINFRRSGVAIYDPNDPSRRQNQELTFMPGLFRGRDPETAQQLRELLAETVGEAERDRKEAAAQAPGDGKAFFQAGELLPPIRKMRSVELAHRQGLALDRSDVISVAELAGNISKGVKEVLARGKKGPEDEASRQRYETLYAMSMLLREYAEGRTAVETGRGKFLFDAERKGTSLSLKDQAELNRLRRMDEARAVARKLEAL